MLQYLQVYEAFIREQKFSLFEPPLRNPTPIEVVISLPIL